jgi:hypothetical protein
LPLLLKLRENYLETTKTVAIAASTTHYAVPERATFRGVVSVNYYNSATVQYPLFKIDGAEAWRYSNGGTTYPEAYYFEGDKIVPTPQPTDTTASLVIRYDRRPSSLTSTDNVGVITAINTSTGVLTCSSIDTSVISTSTDVDLVMAKSGCEILAMDLTPSNVTSVSVTVSNSDVPSSLAVGDYVALAGKTPVVQLPDEFHDLVVLGTALRLLEAFGDLELHAALSKVYQAQMVGIAAMSGTRQQHLAEVISNPNGFVKRRPSTNRFYRGL